MNPKKIVVAAATFACAALLSPNLSQQGGISLAVESANAAHGSLHMHRHARTHMAHAHAYARGPVEAGADIAAGAVNAAGAIAFGALDTAGAIAAAPFYGPSWNDGYYSTSTWGDYDCRIGAPGCRPYAERWAQSGPTYHGGGRDISRPGGRGVGRRAAD